MIGENIQMQGFVTLPCLGRDR